MKSGFPKVLHSAAGRPLLVHVLAAVEPLGLEAHYTVISNRMETFQQVVQE